MFKSFENYLLRDSNSPKVPILFGLIALIIYLTARNSGLYPMIFADEWLYNAYSRYIPADASPRPSYLFYARRAQKPSATFLGENVAWEQTTVS